MNTCQKKFSHWLGGVCVVPDGVCITAGYSQMKKDSVVAVFIQFYTNYISLRVSVTNLPNSIGSVQRLHDDIGLVPVILTAGVCTKPTILAQSECSHMTIPSAGGRDLNLVNIIYSVQHSNHVNDVHEVDCLVLRCLRLISALTAVTINCALLSPSSRFFSKSVTTSCGKRAFSCCDLLLVELVAITESPYDCCDSVYANKNAMKGLKCDSLRGNVKSNGAIHHMATPRSATHTIEAFNHNVNWSNTMAMYKSTQTHPKFKWRFFSCQQSRYFTVEARSEQEVRSMLPDAPCLFSARIRQGVNHA